MQQKSSIFAVKQNSEHIFSRLSNTHTAPIIDFSLKGVNILSFAFFHLITNTKSAIKKKNFKPRRKNSQTLTFAVVIDFKSLLFFVSSSRQIPLQIPLFGITEFSSIKELFFNSPIQHEQTTRDNHLKIRHDYRTLFFTPYFTKNFRKFES